jgi:hypothetical protein
MRRIIDHLRKARSSVLFATIFILAGSAGGVAEAAPAAPAVTPSTWSVSYGTASAAGTATEFLTTLFIGGSLQNTGPGCYFVRATAYTDLGGDTEESARQCGSGATPVNLSFAVNALTQVAEVRVCRVAAPTVCGAAQTLLL